MPPVPAVSGARVVKALQLGRRQVRVLLGDLAAEPGQ
jgi:hypothetical protein